MKPLAKYLVLSLGLLLAASCGRQHQGPEHVASGNEKNREAHVFPLAQHQRFPAEGISSPIHPEDKAPEYYIPSYRPVRSQIPGRIPALKAAEHGLDLQEYRLHSDTLMSDLAPFISGSIASNNKYLILEFDNDIFDNTDYYFTNGVSIELYHPFIQAWPLTRLLLPGLKGSTSYYGLSVVQNIYTPVEIEREDVQYGDRPFSSYLYLGHKKVSLDPNRKIRLGSELDIGMIGPAALGAFVQSSIHEYEPAGWKNQVHNDLVLNYTITLEKGLLDSRWVEGGIKGSMQAGTLYDNLSGGLYLQAGKTDGRFNSLFLNTPPGKSIGERIRYYLTVDLNARMVAYNATLQGGLFNKSGFYSFESCEVNRYVLEGGAGLGFGIGNFSLEAKQVYLSPEFKGGKSHLWMGIKTIFSL